MRDPDTETNLGMFNRPMQRPTITVTEIIAFGLSAIWLVAAFVFFLATDSEGPTDAPDNLRFVMTLLAVCLPVALIWVAAAAARSSRIMREESARLQAAIDAMRQTYVEDRQARSMMLQPSVTQKLDEIAQTAKQTETAVATFASSRDATRPVRPDTDADTTGDQPKLALGTSAEDMAAPLSQEDFIAALNFPETAEDEAGFAALRRALKDRMTSELVRAAQDVLTLLSQDGIYMDDLRPDRARPEIWRRFAAGDRGRAIAPLGGIRDRSSLALAAGRMKQDPVFRDAAHHFLRRFDTTFAEFEKAASDADIVDFADTRSARAFMLLGRVTGTFD
jgi:hypothetical protein